MIFTVQAEAQGEGFRVEAAADGRSKSYFVPTGTQQDFSTFFRDLAADFGTRVPHVFADAVEHPPADFAWTPLLTKNISPRILVGYGDPAVFKDGEDYWLVCTSNDAPDAFPVLHSADLEHWQLRSFIFPQEKGCSWAVKGREKADFWAPEMAKVGDEYWLVFTARQVSNALAIGLARAPTPLGPWVDNGAPLVTGKPLNTTGLGYDASQPLLSGGVINSHLLIDDDGAKYLFWKDDTNSIWPRPLAMLLRRIRNSSTSCSRARLTAAPPLSPRRSCNGRTCSGQWCASS